MCFLETLFIGIFPAVPSGCKCIFHRVLYWVRKGLNGKNKKT